MIEIPNQETLEAMAETREILAHLEHYKGYTDVHQMIRELIADA